MKDALELALDALKGLQRAGRKQGFNDGYPLEMDCAEGAIAALESAIKQRGEPVGEAETFMGSNGGFTMVVFEAAHVPVGTKLYTSAPTIPAGLSRAEWHDKAWALYHAKTFDDLQLSKLNIHTIRAIFDATYDALLSAAPEHKP